MRILIQRVNGASVEIDFKITANIHKGLLVLVGIEEADTIDDIDFKYLEFKESYNIVKYVRDMELIDMFENALDQDNDVSFEELFDRCKDEWDISRNIFNMENIPKSYNFQNLH